jgi:glycosyltransferase involved in cell wall biosynthesis
VPLIRYLSPYLQVDYPGCLKIISKDNTGVERISIEWMEPYSLFTIFRFLCRISTNSVLMPIVSVILPVFNGARFLKEAVDSIVLQTFQDWELIVVDDGSTDNTPEIMKGYQDPRIFYLKNEENKGLVYSLNRAIEASTGRYIARMDADDFSQPDRLEKQVIFLESHPDIGVYDVRQQFIDDTGNPTGSLNSDITGTENILRKMPWFNCMGHPSVMMRAEIAKAYRYRKVVYEDYDLWLRVLNDGLKLERTPEPLLLYRVHSGSIITQSKQANQHFKKIADTKLFYLCRLPMGQWFRFFNLKVLIAMKIDYLTWGFKKIRSLFKGG